MQFGSDWPVWVTGIMAEQDGGGGDGMLSRPGKLSPLWQVEDGPRKHGTPSTPRSTRSNRGNGSTRRGSRSTVVARLAVIAILCLGFPTALSAAEPREELLRLVPEDVGFCLLVQNLRGQSAALLNSPFVKQWRASPWGRALATAPETAKLIGADQHLQKYLHVGWARLRDDILGDAVVLAYRPGPPGKPEQDQGVVLVRARDPQLLADLVERINNLQRQSHDLEALEERRFDGATYFCRQERNNKSYYYIRGPILAFSRQEGLLRETLSRSVHATDIEPALLRHLQRCGVAEDFAALWVNPRAFDAHIEARAKQTSDPAHAIFQAVLSYWKPLEGIALSASLHERDFELKLALVARRERMPPAVRPAFDGHARPSALWQRFPDDAIVAMAGRFNAAAWAQWIGDFLSPSARQQVHQVLARGPGAALGKDIETDVLPYLGPDWGFCLLPPSEANKSWIPDGVALLQVRPDGKTPPLGQVLLGGMNTLASLAVFGYNGNHDRPIVLRTTMQGGTETKYLSGGDLPAGVEPAYAFADDYLMFGSSPAALGRLHLHRTASNVDTTEIPLLRLSVRGLRRYLNAHLDTLAAHVAENDHISQAQALRRLKDASETCRLFDRLEIVERSVPGRLATVLRISTAR